MSFVLFGKASIIYWRASKTVLGVDNAKSGLCYMYMYICDRLRENPAQHGVRNIEKRSIDFLKMYCFKPAEGNG